MSRVATPTLPNPPTGWNPAEWSRWAVDMVTSIGQHFNTLRRDAQIKSDPVSTPEATVAQLVTDPIPKFRALKPGTLVYCVDALPVPCLAYSDGTTWRRVSDNSVVS